MIDISYESLTWYGFLVYDDPNKISCHQFIETIKGEYHE